MSKQNNMRSLNWRQRGLRSVGWKNSDVTVEAPADSILHWDADIDAFSEQTGGVHTFNHAVLSPQYQLGADGSYSNVGAKPAVDVFDGKKWLRSCGAVTNLLPVGYNDMTSSSWTKRGTCTVGVGNLISGLRDAHTGDVFRTVSTTIDAATPISPCLRIKRVSTVGKLTVAQASGVDGRWDVDLSLLGDGWVEVTDSHPAVTKREAWKVSATKTIGFIIYAYVGTDLSVYLDNFQLTATAYPVPYVPPGVTQPASNATTTNGVWFALPDGSELWKALTGTAMTAGFRVRLPFSSADLPNSSVLNLATPDDVAARFLTIQKSAGGALTAVLSDGTNSATVTLAAWNRGDVLHFFPQVAAGATQMRVGYKTDAATSITWGSLATFAGTFGPDSTLDRLMLGYSNAYPFGVNKLTVVTGAKADAEILGWWK